MLDDVWNRIYEDTILNRLVCKEMNMKIASRLILYFVKHHLHVLPYPDVVVCEPRQEVVGGLVRDGGEVPALGHAGAARQAPGHAHQVPGRGEHSVAAARATEVGPASAAFSS